MNKIHLRAASLVLSVIMATTALAGCGKKEETKSPAAVSTQAQVSTAQEVSDSVYPLKNAPALKYWGELNGNVSSNFKNFGDTPMAKELEKRTGVKVEYLHPAAGQTNDAFNIMIASGDLPDIIEYYWGTSFVGGPELAISNGIITKLNDSIDKYAPNLKGYLQSRPDIDKAVKTDSGNYYAFPFIRGDNSLLTTYGLTLRGDWIKDIGQQVPTTLDEWYDVLKGFKEKKGATAPFSLSGDIMGPLGAGIFISAYDIKADFFIDNGKVKYGPFEPAYKDILATLAKWYKEGLIDKNFSANDSQTLDANILNGKTGAITTFPGSGLGKYIPALKEKKPDATLVAAPFPTLKKGDRAKISSRNRPCDGGFIAVSATSKNMEAAVRWLDYGYSEEGNLLYNFGIEGVSYKMENGAPKMTDEVLKNPDKLPIAQAWSKYARGPYSGPFVQRKEYLEQYYVLQEQREAVKLWSDNDGEKTTIPPVTPTQEESAQQAKIMNEVNTYVLEYTMKVIMGSETTDNFGKYIEQLKKMGIEKALEIKQAALDRFNNR